MNSTQKLIILLLSTLTIAVLFVGGYLLMNFSTFWYQTKNPPTPVPTAVARFENPPTAISLPPTWTPKPAGPTAIVILKDQPATQTPYTLPTIPFNQPFTLTGAGSGRSRIFGLPEGIVSIQWEYYGRPGEGADLRFEYNRHVDELEHLRRLFQIDADYYQDLMNSALSQNDAMAYLDAQNGLKRSQAEYDQSVAAENDRYQNSIASIQSAFRLDISRGAGFEPVSLVNVKGTYSGTATYRAKRDFSYNLEVETFGPWKVVVVPPK
jgi:hypothetical protein